MEVALKGYWHPRPFLSLLPGCHDASDLLPYAPNMMCYAATDPKHLDHVSIDWYLRNHEPKNPLLFATSRKWTAKSACKTSVSLGSSPALPEKVLGKRRGISWHTEQNLTKEERHDLLSITLLMFIHLNPALKANQKTDLPLTPMFGVSALISTLSTLIMKWYLAKYKLTSG